MCCLEAVTQCASRDFDAATTRTGACPRVCGQPVPPKHSTLWLNFPLECITLNHMVENEDTTLDVIYRALGDATRRHMLRALAAGELSVSQLAEPFDMSLAAASKHVRVLEQAGLIRREVCGRVHRCRLDAAPLAQAQAWLAFYETFWTARLDRLDQLLRQDSEAGPAMTRVPPPRSRK